MNSILCPHCEKAMPDSAHYCTSCGESITAPEHMTVRIGQRSNTHTPPALETVHSFQTPSSLQDQEYSFADILAQELEENPPHLLTWHKELDAPGEQEDVLFVPRPSQVYPIVLKPLPIKRSWLDRAASLPPLFWMRLLAVSILLLVGVFGVFITIGRGLFNASAGPHGPTLQASSSSVAPGATLTLHGSNFSPGSIAGLSRDAMIPIVDTGYLTRIPVDAKGSFTDTVTISPEWQAGIHTVNAEDATLHKIARFSLFVTGRNTSLRPAHLAISATALDMGSGDFATNSTKQLSLSNIGGGQISWQGSTDQPWLQITPKQGMIADISKVQVTVAVERSTLQPGSYTAHVNFASSAGNSKIDVKMSVVPLDPGHEAVLEVNPAVLSFIATDGGSAPPTQTVNISNPGVRPLQWSVATNAAWLSVSPLSGTIQNASSSGGLITSTPAGVTRPVSVGINTSTLLPGTYSSLITFSGQGQVKDSPQSIVVTITISPQCVLQVAPSLLTFAGAYGQAAPASQNMSIGVAQGCTKTLAWSATSSSQWLVLGTTSGTTPTHPSVSINDAGLNPGTYNDSIVFTMASGTETIPVTFTLVQPNAPIMNTSTNMLTYGGVVGQASPASQNIVITNTAGGTLNWQAGFVSTSGGNWLNITPASGSLAAHQSVSLMVSAQLNSLPPYNYGGTLTISGTDGAGLVAAGSPRQIQVNFVVQNACAVSAGPVLSFSAVIGQAAPAPQTLTIAASGACSHSIAWSVASTTPGGWLTTTPATGTFAPTATASSSVSISLAGLSPIIYNSSVTVTASDSVTNQAIGTPVNVPVTLNVQPACTLQAPSTSTETFSTEAGQNPAPQTFSIAASGTCAGNVSIVPTITLANGTGWLSVTPTAATIPSGGTATFTVNVNGAALTAVPYHGSISLAASNGGVAIVGSPQSVSIVVAVAAPPALSASVGAAIVHGTNGVTSQPINIANTGGTALNWTATLANAPAFVGLSSTSGSLAAGSNDAITIVVTNAAGVVGGSFNASVTLTATDAATGAVVAGSPTTIAITINVAQPVMQLSTSSLTFTTTAGTDPAAQSLTITNVGGATLTWTAGSPSATWLTLDTASGSDASNVSSTITFSVHTAGLAAGTPYSATVIITPSAGPAVTINITLTIAPVALSPTPVPTANVMITPTPTAAPTVTATM